MAAQKAKSHPALVDRRRRIALEPANVVGPEAEARQAEREPAADGLCHGRKGGLAVAAPAEGETLRACGRGEGEEHRFLVSVALLEGGVAESVVEKGVEVVHSLRIHGPVVPCYVRGWDALAEIRLQAVYAYVEEFLEARGKPGACLRVRQVYQAHAGLPEVPLPDIAVLAFEEIAFLGGVVEDRSCLGQIRVYPTAGFMDEVGGFRAGYLALWFGEVGRGEDEVAPGKGVHPEAVKVEDFYWDIFLPHRLGEGGDCLFVVGSGEAGS